MMHTIPVGARVTVGWRGENTKHDMPELGVFAGFTKEGHYLVDFQDGRGPKVCNRIECMVQMQEDTRG